MNLVEKLTEQTQNLKTSYIDKTIEWANQEYIKLEDRSSWNDLDWCNFFKLEPRKVNGMNLLPSGFYNTDKSRVKSRMLDDALKAVRLGRDTFISKEAQKAEDYYANSIEKLAIRIEKKGLNLEKLEISTSYLDPNISTTITDGEQVVRAFTIIASGAVQRPHYRYLVK